MCGPFTQVDRRNLPSQADLREGYQDHSPIGLSCRNDAAYYSDRYRREDARPDTICAGKASVPKPAQATLSFERSDDIASGSGGASLFSLDSDRGALSLENHRAGGDLPDRPPYGGWHPAYGAPPPQKRRRWRAGLFAALGVVLAVLVVGGGYTAFKLLEELGVGGPDVISGADCHGKVDAQESNWFHGGGSYLEAALDEGWIKDSDGRTGVTGANPEQREYLRASFDQLDAEFKNGYEASARNSDGQPGYGNIGYVVFGGAAPSASAAAAADGRLDPESRICVTYGSKDHNWASLQREDPNYRIGDVPIGKRK